MSMLPPPVPSTLPRAPSTGNQPLPPSPSRLTGSWSVGQFAAARNETPETPDLLSADSAERRKNHTWTDDETRRLVDQISANSRYQVALLPGRVTREQEKGQKTKKVTLLRQLFREVFGDNEPTNPNRIKTKIAQLSRLYGEEKRKLGLTGAGLLFEDVEANSQQHELRTRLQSRLPWWETWHRMVIDRPDTTPSHILTGGTYNVDLPGLDDEVEEAQHGRDLPSLDSIMSRSSADPLSQLVLDTPSSHSHSRRCSRDEDQDDDDDSGEDDSISTSGASPSWPNRPRHPHKRPRPANVNTRDAIAQIVQESSQAKLEGKIKVEEERTKREQMRLEFEREKLDRDERLKREEEDRQERLRREEEDRRDRRAAEERKARLEEQKLMMDAMLSFLSSHMANGSSSSQSS